MPFESRSATEVCKQLSEESRKREFIDTMRAPSEAQASLGSQLVSKEIERGKGNGKRLNDLICLFDIYIFKHSKFKIHLFIVFVCHHTWLVVHLFVWCLYVCVCAYACVLWPACVSHRKTV